MDSPTTSAEQSRREQRRLDQLPPQFPIRSPQPLHNPLPPAPPYSHLHGPLQPLLPHPPLHAALQPPPGRSQHSTPQHGVLRFGSTGTFARASVASPARPVATTSGGSRRPAAALSRAAGPSTNTTAYTPAGGAARSSRAGKRKPVGYIEKVSSKDAASEVSRILTRGRAPVAASVPSPCLPHRTAAKLSENDRAAKTAPGAVRQAAEPSSASIASNIGHGRAEQFAGPSGGARLLTGPHRGVSSASVPLTAARPEVRSRSGLPLFRLGIETEFLLAARHQDGHRTDIGEFVAEVAAKYNSKIGFGHPQMRQEIQRATEPGDYLKWSFAYESSNATIQEPCMPPSSPGYPQPDLQIEGADKIL